MKCKAALGRLIVLLATFVLMAGTAAAAGIKVVPSTDRLSPGESFAVDIVAEGIPAEGLGSVQFRLNVEAAGSTVAGVSDLGQAAADAVSVATPLLISSPTSSRSGLGPFFLSGQGPAGILVLDNETLSGGSALFTYGHTKDAVRSSGTGSVARFMIKVGERVEAEEVRISLSDVLLLDGGPEYPLDYNLGATLTLRCNTTVPDLAGSSHGEAEQALADAGLVLGEVYEIDNTAGSHALDEVLEQSVASGDQALCESSVDIAINTAPADVTGLTAADKGDDDAGTAVLSWSASVSADVAGYRVYEGAALLREIPNPQGGGAELNGLANEVVHDLTVKAFDAHGNESAGAAVSVTPLDDVFPVVTVSGVSEGAYYRMPVTVQATATDTNLDHWDATLNDQPFDFSVIDADGAYTLVVTAEDASGNRTEKSVSFTLDRTAPVITVSNLVDGGYYNADLTPDIGIDDANLEASATSYALDGQTYQPGTALAGEGPHTLAISARDKAGNNASLAVNFVIDKIAPVVSIEGVIDGAHYNVDLTPAASVTDSNLKSGSVTLNGQPFVSGAPVTAEGEYVLTVSGEDEAGNSATQSVSFVIDKTTPVVTLGGVVGGTHYNVDLHPTAGVADAYLKSGSVTLNGIAFVSGTSVSEEGEYVLAVSGEDEAGNTASGTVNFVIDKTPPVIAVSGVADGALYNAEVTPVVTISDLYLLSDGLTLNDQPFVSATVVSEEGAYALAAEAEDRAANRTEVALDFIIDKTAPASTSSVGAPQFGVDQQLYIAAGTAVTLNSLDGGAVPTGVDRIEFALDQTEQWSFYGSPFVLADLAEGSHDVHFRSSDRAGNLEDIRTLPIILDKSAPATLVSRDGPQFTDSAGALYVTASTDFSLSAADNLSGVARTEYRIEDGDWTAYEPFTLAGLTDGAHAVFYRSEDNVANSEAQKSLPVMVDNTAPVTSISVGDPRFAAGSDLYVTDATEFSLSAADNVSGVARTEYRIDGGSWTSFAPFTLAGLADGEHTIGYRSIDQVANEEIEQVLAVVIDNTAPVTTIRVAEPKFNGEALYVTGSAEITLVVTDNLSGIARTEYRIDGGSWTTYAPFTLNGLAEGEHAIGYRSLDNLTNTENEQELAVMVDNTPPASSIGIGEPWHAAEEWPYVNGATLFTLSAGDNLAGLAKTEYRIDGGAWVTYVESFTLAGFADGDHAIEYRSVDNVTNVEAAQVLRLTVDNAAPVTVINVGEPKYGADALYVSEATEFTLNATDNLSGIARTEYRIDGGAWTAYAPFTLAGLTDGEHTIGYRSVDNVANVETEQVLAVTVDNTAPTTVIDVGEPKYVGSVLYVTGSTELTLTAADDLAGVAGIEYRINGGAWTAYVPFTLAGLAEGEHLIEFNSVDNLSNTEGIQALTVVVDNTSPATDVRFDHQSYLDGEVLLVSRATEITLSASDELSGVAITQYRFDDEENWYSYYGAFSLTDLAYGTHTLRFRSMDNVKNREEERTVTVTLVGIEVETEILNLPRVLVWTEDPAKQGGKNRPSWTLEEVRALVGEALGASDVYATVTSDKDEFRGLLRSGIYNMTMILNQDVPFDTVFLREMREAVKRGTGLLVSSWGNSVPPLWQDLFGVDFKGSLSMDEEERSLHLFDSPVGADQSLTASGRVVKIALDGGTLAGILPAESACEGLRGLSLHYPLEIAVGDRVTVSLAVPRGKKSVVIDEEELTVTALPEAAINRFPGNTGGDLSIDGIATDGITLTLAAPYAYLEGPYTLSLTVERADGTTVAAETVEVAPVCDANLQGGMSVGPFEVLAVDEERVKAGDDLPAVVLGEYGLGRTAFLSYNLIESALNGERSEHLGLLEKAATWLLPEKVQPEAGGVALIETRLKLLGAGLDLETVDTLGEGLSHLPLFDLTQSPLAYTFHLKDGEQAAWRYYVRFADRRGDYTKSTAVLLSLDGGYAPFAAYPTGFSVGDDSRTLLLQALGWVDGQIPAHPEAADALRAIRDELERIGTLPRTTSAEAETIIHQTVQTLHQALQVGFDTVGLRVLLDQYLRIIEGEAYFN